MKKPDIKSLTLRIKNAYYNFRDTRSYKDDEQLKAEVDSSMTKLRDKFAKTYGSRNWQKIAFFESVLDACNKEVMSIAIMIRQHENQQLIRTRMIRLIFVLKQIQKIEYKKEKKPFLKTFFKTEKSFAFHQ